MDTKQMFGVILLEVHHLDQFDYKEKHLEDKNYWYHHSHIQNRSETFWCLISWLLPIFHV